jgi:D-alanyl-D-alanine carboxypeptidase (penicillin-binding protein 5/6)
MRSPDLLCNAGAGGWDRFRRMRPWSLLASGTIAVAFAAGAAAAPPPVNARAYILVNPATQEVLAASRPDARLPMASTTKLMTALVTLERAKLGDIVVVPKASAAAGGSSSGLVPGERLPVRTLLKGLMVASGNDASIALAFHVGHGSEARFVTMMNREAKQLGLANTHYANPHGLDHAGHYSSVRDMVTLGEQAMEFPVIRNVVRRRVAFIPGPGGRGTRRLQSENDLLAIDRDADGVKTGHTDGAGYALVAHATRASNGIELYAAMIGSPSRAQRARDAKRLLDWGFAQYVRVVPLQAGRVVWRIPVRDRPGVTAPLTVDRTLTVSIHTGRTLRRTLVVPAELVGPLSAGTVVGEVAIKDGGKVLGTRKLVLAEAVNGPSIAERIRSGLWRLV